MTPGNIALSRLFWDIRIGSRLSQFIYSALIFAPLGIVIFMIKDCTEGPLSAGFMIRIILAYVLCPLMLEGILVAITGRSFRLENLIYGLTFPLSSYGMLELLVRMTRRYNFQPA
jgi:hypothetical protein